MKMKLLSLAMLSVALGACGGGGGSPTFSNGGSTGGNAPLVIPTPSVPDTISEPVSAEDISGHYFDSTGNRLAWVGRDGVFFSVDISDSGTASFATLAPKKVVVEGNEDSIASTFAKNSGLAYTLSAPLAGGDIKPFTNGQSASVSGSFDGKKLKTTFAVGDVKAIHTFSPDALSNEAEAEDFTGKWTGGGALPFTINVAKNGENDYLVSGSYKQSSTVSCTMFGAYTLPASDSAVPFRNVLSFNSEVDGEGLSVVCSGAQSFKTAVVGLNNNSLIVAIRGVPTSTSGLLLRGTRAAPVVTIDDDYSSGYFVAGSGSVGHFAALAGSAVGSPAVLVDLERDAAGASKTGDRLTFANFRMNDGSFTAVTNSFGFAYQSNGSTVSDRVFAATGNASTLGSYTPAARISNISKTDTVNNVASTTSLVLKTSFDVGGLDSGDMDGSFCAGDGQIAGCDIGSSLFVSSTTIQGEIRYAPCTDAGVCGGTKIDACKVSGSVNDAGGRGVYDTSFSITCPGSPQIVRNYTGIGGVVKLPTGTETSSNASAKLVLMVRDSGNRDARVFLFKRSDVAASAGLKGMFVSATSGFPLTALIADTSEAVLANNLAGRIGNDDMIFGRVVEDANGGVLVQTPETYKADAPGYFNGTIQTYAKAGLIGVVAGTTTATGDYLSLDVATGDAALDASYSLFKRQSSDVGATFSSSLQKDFCVTTLGPDGQPLTDAFDQPITCDILNIYVDSTGALVGSIDMPWGGRLYEDCSIEGNLGATGLIGDKNIVAVKDFTITCDDGVNIVLSGIASSIKVPVPGKTTFTELQFLLRDAAGAAVKIKLAPDEAD